MRKQRRQRVRQGFTLMEIILVAAILVIIASMATIGYLSMQQNSMSRLARNEIKLMEQACIAYKMNNQMFPTKLEDLFQLPQGMTKYKWGGPYLTSGDILDPWESEYTYAADEQNNMVLITSPGPDRQTGTEDDISSDNNANTGR